MKFDEKNVINELHKSKVKEGQTGFFADDIMTLKKVITKNKEDYFGKIRVLSPEQEKCYSRSDKRPFYTEKGNGFLFYPANFDDVFNQGYEDYRKMYKDIKINTFSYAEFARLWNLIKDGDDSNWDQYLFSAPFTASPSRYYNEPLPKFLKKGYVTVLIKAPTLEMAYVTINTYFENLVEWDDIGIKGRDIDASIDFWNIRYFGNFSSNMDYQEIKEKLKLYEPDKFYNLDTTAKKISYKDLKNKSISYIYGFFKNHVEGNMYSSEIKEIMVHKSFKVMEKSLKERVEEAFEEAGVKNKLIYYCEFEALLEDFDTTIKKLIQMAKKFESEDYSDLKEIIKIINKSKRLKSCKYKIDRPNLLVEDYSYIPPNSKYSNRIGSAPDSAYVKVKKRDITKSLANLTLHSTIDKEMLSRSDAFIVVSKDLNFTEFEEIDRNNYGSLAYSVNDKVCICTDETVLNQLSEENKSLFKHWSNFLKPTYELLDLSKFDLHDINHLETYGLYTDGISLENIEGHDCLKVHTVETRSSFYKMKRYEKYEELLNKMKKYNYHLVKITQLGYVNRNYNDDEHMNLYFAKNKENKDYTYTYTEGFWKELLKGDWW